MESKMRIMSEKPLNAETPNAYLRSWITANSVFFDRNQGEIMAVPIPLSDWELIVEGEVEKGVRLNFDQILRLPKAIAADTLECSGNSRSLLKEKAKGNPWTIGGVGNAVWGGVWLKDLLEKAGLKGSAKHVSFEGLDKPLGSAGIKFIRSIPLEKAMSSTLLAYEMNGEPLPLKHGYPLRALALGWTGANCVKWLHKITVMEKPFEGFYMDKVYRVFQKGEDPKSGPVVTSLKLKSIITQPVEGERLPAGPVTILGAAYAGEAHIERVEISVDEGKTWDLATFIGPDEPFAWRQWQYVWEVKERGNYRIMARATDSEGRQQPMNAAWNVLGYGNNGIQEHAVTVEIM
jgi:DMSO/TMAO reductase YedYZ molybdopterin-dependent catalytic subunit